MIYWLSKDLLQWMIKTYICPSDYLNLLLTAKLFHCLTDEDRSTMYYNNLVEIIKNGKKRELFFDQHKYKIYKNSNNLMQEMILIDLGEVPEERIKDIFKSKHDYMTAKYDKYSLCEKCLYFILNEKIIGHTNKCKVEKKKCQECNKHREYDCCCELKKHLFICPQHKVPRHEMWKHKHKRNNKTPTRFTYYAGRWHGYEQKFNNSRNL